ncbi:hypothetical protein J6590_070808 [Homalodisca vitripennis]|nr:hypothetical protein J6590_070808 [Homalodisca vitripennis]
MTQRSVNYSGIAMCANTPLKLYKEEKKPAMNVQHLSDLERQLGAKQDEINVLEGKVADLQHRLAAPQLNAEVWKKISAKEEDIRQLSEKIRELEQQMVSSTAHTTEDLKRRLNLKEEEILNLRERLKHAEKSSFSHDQQQNNVLVRSPELFWTILVSVPVRHALATVVAAILTKNLLNSIAIATGNHFPSTVALSAACRGEILILNEEFCEHSHGTFQPQLLAYESNGVDSSIQIGVQHQCSVQYEHFLVVPLAGELWRKLNLKEEEILTLREKIRDLERNQMSFDFTQANAELWRKLNIKEDELSRMQDKIRTLEQNISEYSLLKRKYNQKEEENLTLREQIREYECNKCNSSGLNQGLVTRLEMERDAAKGDCVRLREEINTLRNDLQRLRDCQHSEQLRLDQAQKDFDNCVAQFEVERRSLTGEIKQLTEELRQFKDKVRELQSDAGEQRTRCNHLKLVNEQTERELRTTQDLLHQTETELASALDRVQELNDEAKQLEWDLKEARQERTCLKANMTRLDQEKDSLLIKVDEKTEQNVRLEAELESRSCRIANLEAFIADLQKKLE